MKLLLGEIKLFSLIGVFDYRNTNKKITFVYVGSAPGYHIPCLVELTRAFNPNCKFYLYDGKEHCSEVKRIAASGRGSVIVRQQLFSEKNVATFKGDGIVVMINDIRSGGDRMRGPPKNVIMDDQRLMNRIIEESIKHNVFDFIWSKLRINFPTDDPNEYETMRVPKTSNIFIQAKTKPSSIETRGLTAIMKNTTATGNTRDKFVTAFDAGAPGIDPYTGGEENRWVLPEAITFTSPSDFWEYIDHGKAVEFEQKMAFYNQKMRSYNQDLLIHHTLKMLPELSIKAAINYLKCSINKNKDNKKSKSTMRDFAKRIVNQGLSELLPDATDMSRLVFPDYFKKECHVPLSKIDIGNLRGTPLLYVTLDLIGRLAP